ncbi:MAG: hypothetical protein ACRD0U_21660 [Acidimicrobiales bacterium]
MARGVWVFTIAVSLVLLACSDDDSGGGAKTTSTTAPSEIAVTTQPGGGPADDLCAQLQAVNLLITGQGPSAEQLQDLRDRAPEQLRDDLDLIIANLDSFDPGDATVFNAFATINLYLLTECAHGGTEPTDLPIPPDVTG